MRAGRDDAGILAGVGEVGILQLGLEPSELVRELLASTVAHLDVEQEAAARRVGDDALEVTEIAEIGLHATADPADHRPVDHHPPGRDAAGPAREGALLALRVEPLA